jgi:hypothetical protein
MEESRKWFMIVVAAWVGLGAVIFIVRLAMGEFKFFYRAKFTEFYVCEGPDPTTGLPQEPMTTVSPNAQHIFACGNLDADGKVPLHFLLFYEGKSTQWNDDVEDYRTGYVFQELPQSWRKPGDYRVEVRLQGHLVDSTEFAISYK